MSTQQRRSNAGLATLEWLLVITAAGGFAAAMTAGVDRLIADRTARPPADAPAARTAARIHAARINDRSAEALAAVHLAASAGDTQAAEAASARLERLKHACQDLPRQYPDALTSAAWEWQPIALPQPPAAPDGGRWVCSLNGQTS